MIQLEPFGQRQTMALCTERTDLFFILWPFWRSLNLGQEVIVKVHGSSCLWRRQNNHAGARAEPSAEVLLLLILSNPGHSLA